jgi:hypothetical protein
VSRGIRAAFLNNKMSLLATLEETIMESTAVHAEVPGMTAAPSPSRGIRSAFLNKTISLLATFEETIMGAIDVHSEVPGTAAARRHHLSHVALDQLFKKKKIKKLQLGCPYGSSRCDRYTAPPSPSRGIRSAFLNKKISLLATLEETIMEEIDVHSEVPGTATAWRHHLSHVALGQLFDKGTATCRNIMEATAVHAEVPGRTAAWRHHLRLVALGQLF